MSQQPAPDVEAYRLALRQEWNDAALGWRRWIDTLEAARASPLLTDALLDAARIGTGDVVLDVGTGYGEPGLSAARRVGPEGRVICLDLSGDMLAFAEQRARAAGLDNVDFVEADVERLDHTADSLDAVISRAALMYAVDVPSVLRRLRQLLRPGGRLAVAVWGTPDTVAFAAPVPVMIEVAGIEPPAGGPGPFALGEPGLLAALVADAGYTDVTSSDVTVTYEFEEAPIATRWIQDVAPPLTQLIADRPPDVQERVWDHVTRAWAQFRGDDGRIHLPCRAVVVAATRPG